MFKQPANGYYINCLRHHSYCCQSLQVFPLLSFSTHLSCLLCEVMSVGLALTVAMGFAREPYGHGQYVVAATAVVVRVVDGML